jgi:hypothetical protein
MSLIDTAPSELDRQALVARTRSHLRNSRSHIRSPGQVAHTSLATFPTPSMAGVGRWMKSTQSPWLCRRSLPYHSLLRSKIRVDWVIRPRLASRLQDSTNLVGEPRQPEEGTH